MAFTCPRCGAVSHNPTDQAEGYCGRCHDWTAPVDSEPLWERCAECMRYYRSQPHLLGAFASVGIEHGKSTYQMAVDYFDYYHSSHHRKPS